MECILFLSFVLGHFYCWVVFKWQESVAKYIYMYIYIYQSSFWNHKVFCCPFSQQSEAQTYLMLNCDLQDFWLNYPSFAHLLSCKYHLRNKSSISDEGGDEVIQILFLHFGPQPGWGPKYFFEPDFLPHLKCWTCSEGGICMIIGRQNLGNLIRSIESHNFA